MILLETPLNRKQACQLIDEELDRAFAKHPSAGWNAHQGYAILLEEVDEAWDEIKRDDLKAARKEMIQVAAMAIRFLVEVGR